MADLEKVLLILALFAGFFWLRRRARGLSLEGRMERATLGVFVVLPAMLIGEWYLFAKLPFGFWTNLPLKILGLGAAFSLVGYGFLKGYPPGDGVDGNPIPAGDAPAADTPASIG